MANLETETLRACVDCLFFAEYGNHSEHDECFRPDEWAARQAELATAHAARGPLYATGADPDEFSTHPCEVCGSRLAGARETMVEYPSNG